MRSTVRPASRMLRRAAAAGGAIALAASLSACTGASGPDASPEGQVAYACALAAQVGDGYAGPDDWESFVGDDADPGAIATLAAASLLGGGTGGEVDASPDLSEAATTVFQGVQLADFDRLRTGLDDIRSACEEVDDVPTDAATPEGQLAYACELAEATRAEHGDAEAWGSEPGHPAWREASSVGALVGALNGATVPGAEAVADAGGEIVVGVSRVDPEGIVEALDAFVAGCEG